ncbi:glycosyltransferase family 2 protein [Solwaraspora sp. WMMD406]|uniref:glycosyltransferase family 2 protein n=1 Tax=Solwaraspora sp. WMMD406 TaxID=3016095 RepID=UPI002415B4E4|nr:glycosyltransferase family 2 protein [Solwaraspora sp. WMMD406]MDG4764939.1 glycosyltransferase family 2 protein [Solwaraspora sp. WMMD406]
MSVIVPCHNSTKTIALCIESVLAQSYSAIELIVVDDASNDQTTTIVERYDCTLVPLSQNVGAGIARNRGISASHGEILFFLDSDVALAPDAVENAVHILDADPALGAAWGVYGDRPLVDDGIVERVQVLYGHYRQIQPSPVFTGHFAVGAVRRRVVDEIGMFDERLFGQWTNEDHEFGLRIAAHFPVTRALDVVGYHDDDDNMWSVLHKRFGRAVSLMPLILKQRDLKPEREALHRPPEIAAVFLSAVTAPLPLLSPYLIAVPAVFALWFVYANLPMLGFVRRNAGWRVVLTTVLLNYAYGLAVGAGGATGALRYLVDPRFRRRYQTDEPGSDPHRQHPGTAHVPQVSATHGAGQAGQVDVQAD